MAESEVLKSFLVDIFYQVDGNSERKFTDSVGSATKQVVAFGTAIAATAVAVTAAVAKMADGLEQLYFASRRTGSSVQDLKAASFAITQLGGSAQGAQASMENLGRFMRSSPGALAMLRSLGVQSTDAAGALQELGDKFRGMPFYQANAYAGLFGIDERTLMALIDDVGEFSERYRAMYRAAGIDAQKAAADSHSFMVSLRDLGAAAGVLSDKVASQLTRRMGADLDRLRDLIVANFDRISRVIVRVAEVLISIADGLTTLMIRAVRLAASLIDWYDKLDAGSRRLVNGFALVGVAWWALSRKFLLSPIGALVAALGALLLLIDDYQGYQEGKESAIDWSKWEGPIENAKKGLRGIWTYLDDNITATVGWQTALEALAVFMVGSWLTRMTRAITGVRVGILGLAGIQIGLIKLMDWLVGDVGTQKGVRDDHSAFGQWIYDQFPSLRYLDNLIHGNKPPKESDGTPGPAPGKGANGQPQTRVERVVGAVRGWFGSLLGGSSGGDVGQNAQAVIDFFMGKGWTREQAAGIAANIQTESGFNPHGPAGDGGTAYGLAQWHPDRRAKIERHFGKTLEQMSFTEQLEAIQWELTAGQEAAAGGALGATQGAYNAGSTVSRQYERPGVDEAARAREAAARGALAQNLYNDSAASAESQIALKATMDRIRAQVAQATVALPENPDLAGKAAYVTQINHGAAAPAGTSGGVTMTQTTTIHVAGASNPQETADRVGAAQGRVNADLQRNMQTVAR